MISVLDISFIGTDRLLTFNSGVVLRELSRESAIELLSRLGASRNE